jgi:hypothetical protein
MSQPGRDDHQFRRGVVLGLTFAEVLLLLLFVLMLILASRLFSTRAELQREVTRRSAAEHALVILKPVLQRLGTPADKFDITKEWVRLHDEAAQAKAALDASKPVLDLVEKRKRQSSGESQAQAAQQVAADAEAGRRFAKLASDMFPGSAPVSAQDQLESAARLGKSLMGKSSTEGTIAKQYSSCVSNLNTCKAQNSNLSARLGGVLPPCWVDDTGKTEYIYDTHLKEDGIWVTDNHVPDKEKEQAALSLGKFVFGRPMSQMEFVQAGQPLMQYGGRNGCRFYVRVFDDTGVQSKLRYKELLKGVEGVFYKLLVQ